MAEEEDTRNHNKKVTTKISSFWSYEVEQKHEERERHPINQREKHTLYPYDTLRRAKHSLMMVLYHLHNQGWRCEVCPDYDICKACHQKDGGIDHPHKLTNLPLMADPDVQNKELREMLDVIVHASQCRSPHCQYPNCRKVKGLFQHGIQCKTYASGGCVLCKKMWYLLQLHSRECKESECYVPRCKDLKEHLRRLQQQSD